MVYLDLGVRQNRLIQRLHSWTMLRLLLNSRHLSMRPLLMRLMIIPFSRHTHPQVHDFFILSNFLLVGDRVFKSHFKIRIILNLRALKSSQHVLMFNLISGLNRIVLLIKCRKATLDIWQH